MDTPNIKNELHQMIDQIGDDKVLGAVHTLLSNQTVAYSIDGMSLSQKAFEEMIDQGEDDVRTGKIYTQDEVKSHFDKKMNG